MKNYICYICALQFINPHCCCVVNFEIFSKTCVYILFPSSLSFLKKEFIMCILHYARYYYGDEIVEGDVLDM
jgi:hypothetical protein